MTIVVELLIFLVTVYVLWRLIWRPIIQVLETRDRRLAAGEHAAAEAERRYREGLAEVQQTLDSARTQARDALAHAHHAAAEQAELARAEARARAHALTEEALSEIRREREAAVESLHSQARTLAVAAASRLLDSDLDPERFSRVAGQAVRS